MKKYKKLEKRLNKAEKICLLGILVTSFLKNIILTLIFAQSLLVIQFLQYQMYTARAESEDEGAL